MKYLFIVVIFILSAAPAFAAEPLYYDKASIEKDTTWSGTVVLRGQNVVKKGTTLTILPGTVVKFAWIDEDGDNIGDGELNVEGKLIAKGTKDNMITFTSAQEKPKMKDWTFLMISVNKDSLVEYCKFEYAFSGVQVHYSTATIRNCLIQKNFEGIRFSTTDVVIEHNDIVNNTYGIRYEARGSRTTIADNVFRGNDYAFFPLQKCTSTVMIHDNNITDNAHYSVYMGENQRADLDYTKNWWGTKDKTAIEDGVFDKGKDETIGQVLFEPFLDRPVQGAGIQ